MGIERMTGIICFVLCLHYNYFVGVMVSVLIKVVKLRPHKTSHPFHEKRNRKSFYLRDVCTTTRRHLDGSEKDEVSLRPFVLLVYFRM